jgi:hypothetical protein
MHPLPRSSRDGVMNDRANPRVDGLSKNNAPKRRKRCGASCLPAPLRPRTARVNNSRHTRRIYFSYEVGKIQILYFRIKKNP